MPHFYDKKGQPVWVPDEQAAQAWESGQYGLPKAQSLNIKNDQGELGSVSPQELGKFLKLGWKIESQEEEKQRYYEENYGDQDVGAFAAGAGRGLTFGLSDLALTGLGVVEPETLEGLREANPIASTAGELTGIAAGLVTPAGLAGIGKMATTGSIVSRAAQTAAKAAHYNPVYAISNIGLSAAKMTEKQLLGSILKGDKAGHTIAHLMAKSTGMAAGAALEGAAYGVGAAVTEEALGNLDGVSEALSSYVIPYALIGGATGGVFGGAGVATAAVTKKAVEKVTAGAAKLGAKFDVKSIAADQIENRVYSALKAQPKNMNAQKRDAFRSMLFADDVLPDGAIVKEGIKDDEIFARLKEAAETHGERIGQFQLDMDNVIRDFNLSYELLPKPNKLLQRLRDDIIPELEKSKLNPHVKSVYNEAEAMASELEMKMAEAPFWSFEEAFKLKKSYNESAAWGRGKEVNAKINFYRDIAKEFAGELDEAYLRVSEGAGLSDMVLSQYKRSQEIYKNLIKMKNLSQKAQDKLGSSANEGVGGILARFGSAFGRQAIWNSAIGIPSMAYRAAAYTALNVAAKKSMGASAFKPVSLSELDKIARFGLIKRKIDKVEQRVGIFSKMAAGTKDMGKRSLAPASTNVFKHLTKENDREKAAEKFSERVQQLSSNPEKFANLLSPTMFDLEDIAPNTSTKMAELAARILQVLHRASPKIKNTPSLQPMLEAPFTTPNELSKFERIATAALYPVDALESGLENNDLTRETIETINELYPNLMDSVKLSIVEDVQKRKEKLSYAQVLRIYNLFGLPLHQSQTPGYIQRAQQMYSQGGQQGNVGSGAIDKTGKLTETHTTNTQRLGGKL